MSGPDRAERARECLGYSRWWQIAAAVLVMALISPYQYVWSSIEGPIATRLGVSLPALGTVFTLFVIVQAGSQFPVGWWRDRHGPRRLMLLAGVLTGGGYVGLSYATAVWQLYLLYSLGALGVGIVYTVAVNTAIKWFPDRRGLTTGLGTMAFAAGSALAVPFVRANATAADYPVVLRSLGVLIGVGVLGGALFLRDPPGSWHDAERGPGESPPDGGGEGGPPARQYTWREVLRTWQFWLMYGMFVAVSGAGLMVTAKIVSFADALGLSATVATASATLLPLASGAGRLVVGDLADRLPLERAMAGSFLLCGVGLLAIVRLAESGSTAGFLLAVVVATFFWSPLFTLFPTAVGEYYGSEHSSANYALLYSGKMWGGVFGGGLAGWLVATADWPTAFAVGAGMAVLAGVGALLLRPPRTGARTVDPADSAPND